MIIQCREGERFKIPSRERPFFELPARIFLQELPERGIVQGTGFQFRGVSAGEMGFD